MQQVDYFVKGNTQQFQFNHEVPMFAFASQVQHLLVDASFLIA